MYFTAKYTSPQRRPVVLGNFMGKTSVITTGRRCVRFLSVQQYMNPASELQLRVPVVNRGRRREASPLGRRVRRPRGHFSVGKSHFPEEKCRPCRFCGRIIEDNHTNLNLNICKHASGFFVIPRRRPAGLLAASQGTSTPV